jgi:hypothetical protein
MQRGNCFPSGVQQALLTVGKVLSVATQRLYVADKTDVNDLREYRLRALSNSMYVEREARVGSG